jgi:hypothetical protein
MIRPTFVCGLAALAAIVTASAGDFPLTFQTIPAKDVMAFPGGYGVSAQLRLVKPKTLKKEPKAVSRRPLYGECRETSTGAGFLVRLDESKGDGKGYDVLIVDMNQNGDLTDDPATPLLVPPTDRKPSAQAARQKLFGPIQAPAGKLIAGGRPIYFAQAYLNNLSYLGEGQDVANIYAGQLRLKAGWYLDTTVELKGLKQKVGVFDGDCNLRLDDVAKPQTYHNAGEEENWYFGAGDFLLTDVDGSGAFENDAFDSESCPYGPILYFGATPYKVALAPDCKSLRVEPWTDPLAEVALKPHGDQVCSVTLAWELPNKQWQLIRAGVADGKIKVPPGNYRLSTCVLLGKGVPRDQVMTSAYQRVPKKPFNFAAGKANTLRCGAPLEIKVTAEKRKPESWEHNSGDLRNPPLALRLPRKTVMAHGSRIPREHYDFHHVAETGVASPQTLKTWNPVTLAIEVSAQFSDNGHCFAECALVRVFFLASSPSTSHSMGLNSTSHGSSGTSRPKRANNMIRQAITASMVMARSNTSAL